MPDRSSLVKEADRVFSLYVRNRGATYDWNHCYTCSKYLPVENLQAGHFIPRRYHRVRWHPMNVWPQCHTCNVSRHGNLERYEKKLVQLYTQDAVDGLWDIARSSEGIEDWEIREIIKKYKNA